MEYTNVFSYDLAIEQLDNTRKNGHVIELVDSKQLIYGPIYSFSPIELEKLKTFIKTHPKSEFVQPSKALTGASILFQKSLIAI